MRRSGLAAVVCVGIMGITAIAGPPDPAAVDRHVAAGWERAGVAPAAPTDDAEFLRRASLDLAGRVPTVAEVRGFLADRDPDKRAKLVDRLLAGPASATHFARFWRERWLPQSAAQFEELRPEFEDWLRDRLAANVPYDRVVRDLLRPASANAPPGDRRSLAVFLQANEFKPANLADSTARMFLGVNLGCAQCHDHPFAKWTRQQFWESAAFFAGPGGVTAPGAKAPATPRFLDGTAPQAGRDRAALADWITAPGNPYFARNAVNQVWAYLFGTGLVEPLDDLSGDNPASHPELLAELAAAFTASGHDLRFLLRTLTRTRAYQLSSAARPGETAPPDPRLFARAAVRAMTGDQLYDSLLVAAGFDAAAADRLGVPRAEFLGRFGRPDRPSEAGRTILQSLLLANGDLVAAATDPRRGPTLAAADAPFLAPADRIEALYLATLSRQPRPDEVKRLTAAVEDGDPQRGLAAVMWALLNCHEFATVH